MRSNAPPNTERYDSSNRMRSTAHMLLSFFFINVPRHMASAVGKDKTWVYLLKRGIGARSLTSISDNKRARRASGFDMRLQTPSRASSFSSSLVRCTQRKSVRQLSHHNLFKQYQLTRYRLSIRKKNGFLFLILERERAYIRKVAQTPQHCGS